MISQNCPMVDYINCDTSVLSCQTNCQEYKITGLNAFHPQIKYKLFRFNKNKSVSTQLKMFMFYSFTIQ